MQLARLVLLAGALRCAWAFQSPRQTAGLALKADAHRRLPLRAATADRPATALRGGETAAAAARPERVLQPLSFIFVLSVAVVALAPAPALIARLGAPRATELLALVNSASAAAEICLAPVVGALADRFGRKPVLLGVLGLVLLANGAACAFPCVPALLATKFVGSLVVGLYFLASGAMLGDAYKAAPARLAAASGVLFALVNVGFTCGIVLSSSLPGGGGGGSLRALYACATAAAAAALGYGAVGLRETNPTRLPFRLRAFNPVSCARLFRGAGGREMRLLACLLALTLQPIFMGDVLQIFAIKEWGLQPGQVASFFGLVTALGAAGNIAGGPLIKIIGSQAFTALATCSNLLFWVGCATSYRAAVATAVVGFLGAARTVVVSASLTSCGGKRGIAQGQLSGDRANLIAILKIIGPAVYGQLYVRGSQRGVPSAPFVLNILLTAGALALAPIALSAASRVEDTEAKR